ncbi:MAG: RNA pseudouridine synthase [Bacteroidetes bacterium]|nr:RluA family pseudouridine synthase [Bacteroidia bacterium]PCH69345.1 MAG: RNA pseudouridine synthase [Bacteroidota bacterium]
MAVPKFEDLIIYEGEDTIVVNKPALISTLDDRVNKEVNLLLLAKKYQRDLQACHRLDKETSGALIFAKNPESYRNISIQFQNRKVDKTYHAVIEGVHKFENLEVDLPILNLRKERVKVDQKDGKKAKTLFNSIEFYKNYTLVECKPITGRLHQIRIHLSSLGAVIVGDEVYGGIPFLLSRIKKKYKTKTGEEERPIMNRFSLHAHRVVFKNIKQENIEVIAEYPKDFAVLKKLLDKHNS